MLQAPPVPSISGSSSLLKSQTYNSKFPTASWISGQRPPWGPDPPDPLLSAMGFPETRALTPGPHPLSPSKCWKARKQSRGTTVRMTYCPAGASAGSEVTGQGTEEMLSCSFWCWNDALRNKRSLRKAKSRESQVQHGGHWACPEDLLSHVSRLTPRVLHIL